MRQRERFFGGDGATGDHAIEIRVMSRDFTRLKQLPDEERVAQLWGAEDLRFVGTRGVMDLHGTRKER